MGLRNEDANQVAAVLRPNQTPAFLAFIHTMSQLHESVDTRATAGLGANF
jgi:hypothetical protein